MPNARALTPTVKKSLLYILTCDDEIKNENRKMNVNNFGISQNLKYFYQT